MEEGKGHFHIICMVSRREGDLKGRGDEVPSPNKKYVFEEIFSSTYCVPCLGKGRKYESFASAITIAVFAEMFLRISCCSIS